MSDILFCFGYGNVTRQLTLRMKAVGWVVYATARSQATLAQIERDGAIPLSAEHKCDIPPEAYWVISAPPTQHGCPAHARFANQSKTAAWIGYLSTTGVYGDLKGGWAFEWSHTRPQSDPAKARIQAETAWRNIYKPLSIFRLPGIYGPGRSAFERVQTGKARCIIKPGHVISRIHRDDIVTGLMAAIERKIHGQIFHLVDDYPAPPQDVICYAAELLKLPPPVKEDFEQAELPSNAQRFYQECRRVSNARTKAMLGWRPQYPDYISGLTAILDVYRNA